MEPWIFGIFRVGKSTMVHRPRDVNGERRKQRLQKKKKKKKDKGNLEGQTRLGSLEWKAQAQSKDILPLQSSRHREFKVLEKQTISIFNFFSFHFFLSFY